MRIYLSKFFKKMNEFFFFILNLKLRFVKNIKMQNLIIIIIIFDYKKKIKTNKTLHKYNT